MAITSVTGSNISIGPPHNLQTVWAEMALLQEAIVSGSEFLTGSLELFQRGYETKGFYSDGTDFFLLAFKSATKK